MSPIVTVSHGTPFLNWQDLKKGDVLKVTNEGEIVESSFKKDDGTTRMELRIQVEHNGAAKTYTVNGASKRNIVPFLGNDTAGWVGKTLGVRVKMLPTGKGSIITWPEGEEDLALKEEQEQAGEWS